MIKIMPYLQGLACTALRKAADFMLDTKLNQLISQQQKLGLYRKCRFSASGKQTISFSSNDYLSLRNDARIKAAYCIGANNFPAGSGGSMLLGGYHPVHRELEQTFAKALKVDACLLFTSGYAANLSVAQLLASIQAHVLIDKAVHASVYDGLKFANAEYSRYLHNDLDDFCKKIKQIPEGSVIMTESVFSMSGQKAKLPEIAQIARSRGIKLVIDEAHAFGVFGEQGLGSVVESGLSQNEVPLRVIPFGKAMAASGAVVAGQSLWIEALLQCARPYIYSTALSPAYTYGLLETLKIVQQADMQRKKLLTLVDYFRHAISQSPLKWRNSNTPIQQLHLGCPRRAVSYADMLQKQGIMCFPIRQPTVNKQETGLRVILNYNHTPDDINLLFSSLHHHER